VAVNETDKLGDAGAKAKYSRPGVRMRDVAVAAGVSVATVSNVINHPDLVAERTRERVRCIVQELKFQPDPHATALRGLGIGVSEPRGETALDSAPRSQEQPLETPNRTGAYTRSAPESSGLDPESLKPGISLSFRVGPEFVSGTIDAVMPDKSCFWMWTDGGMGRRMIDTKEVVAVETEASE
jgi:Bacterial regulatory proteins, lacI family